MTLVTWFSEANKSLSQISLANRFSSWVRKPTDWLTRLSLSLAVSVIVRWMREFLCREWKHDDDHLMHLTHTHSCRTIIPLSRSLTNALSPPAYCCITCFARLLGIQSERMKKNVLLPCSQVFLLPITNNNKPEHRTIVGFLHSYLWRKPLIYVSGQRIAWRSAKTTHNRVKKLEGKASMKFLIPELVTVYEWIREEGKDVTCSWRNTHRHKIHFLPCWSCHSNHARHSRLQRIG